MDFLCHLYSTDAGHTLRVEALHIPQDKQEEANREGESTVVGLAPSV